jgi:NurA-like 5'-3' nuclease
MLPIKVEDLRRIVEENKSLVVKVGNTYEISRPLALKLWSAFVSMVMEMGGSVREELKVEYVSSEMVIVSVSCTVRVGESEVRYCEIGEAYKSEGKEDTMARTAYTRAMKRLLERMIGEDFINQVIQKLYPDGVKEVPASEKQKQLIRSLVQEGKITKEMVREVLGEGVSLNQAIKENTLTFSQARALINKALRSPSNE